MNLFTGRRALLQVLAGTVLVSTWRFSLGQADQAKPDKAGVEAVKASDAEKGKAGATKGPSSLLNVIVTGDGKPIANAEVKVKLLHGAGGEAQLHTDSDGKASFKVSGTGAASVRILVTGWKSEFQDVELKEGEQELTIPLKPRNQNE